MPFIRKSIDRKPKEGLDANQTFNTTSSSVTLSSVKNIELEKTLAESIEKIATLKKSLKTIPVQSLQKQVSDALGPIADAKKGILNSKKLLAYKEAIQLVTAYQQVLKLNGREANQQNSSICLTLFKVILDELKKLTQESKMDEAVNQSNIAKSFFELMDELVISVESEATKAPKSSKMLRKNSLKKAEDLPEVRPHSRGKLSSLAKKDRLKKDELLGIKQKPQKGQSQISDTIFNQTILSLCCITKDLSANKLVKKELLQEHNLRLFNRYLSIWNQKTIGECGNAVLVQLTACMRHLVAQGKYKCFLNTNSFDVWARLIEMFPTSYDMVFNILRVLTKLSGYESCCVKLNEKKGCLQKMSSFFKMYKKNIHIIIRVACIFANMTSYLADIRNQLYFKHGIWSDVLECFEHYALSELTGKNEVDKMGLTMTAWDYQAIKKESDIEAVIKLIHLITNLFTVQSIGKDIYVNQAQSYKNLIKMLSVLLEKKTNLTKSQDLISSILSCLTNVLYYDREVLMSTSESKLIKNHLITILVDYIVQIEYEEICCEGLRVLSNLTRMKEHVKNILDAKVPDAVLILLGSTSKDIVYYSLGILSNLLLDDTFKYAPLYVRQAYKQLIISNVVQVLSECGNQDFDVVSIGLKTLAAICENLNENLDPQLLTQIENCLVNLGSHCDRVMIAQQNHELQSVEESRALINSILNSMPEEKFVCPIKNCGRKFGNEEKMQDHIKRRHKIV